VKPQPLTAHPRRMQAGTLALQSPLITYHLSKINLVMTTKKKASDKTNQLVPVALIERRIYLIRGQKVMLDSDLAALYGVPTKVFNQAVKRNIERFPEDFMFHLTNEEAAALRSQIVTLKPTGRGQHRKYLPYVFTEQGVAMPSGVLHSPHAVEVNIAIMRTFVKLREMLRSNEELSRKFAAVIRKLSEHDKYFKVVFDELQKLTHAPATPAARLVSRPMRRMSKETPHTKRSLRALATASLFEWTCSLS
jgi:phosphoenolpyruvate carboxylase